MRRTLGIVCAGLIGLLTLSPSSGGPETATRVAESSSAPAATPVVPAQFVAKMYTEALGRHPDPGGWAGWLDAFARAGCSTETTSDVARRFFTSGEFLSRGYDNPARVLALYRGALNREPDQGGFDHWTGQLDRAMTWPQLVDLFVGSAEFARLAAVICGSSTSYAFGTHPAPTLPVTGPGFAGGTGAELQAVLDSTPAGGTVQLAQKAVVRLDATLDVPAGVTLTTTGAPGPSRYALQGRLVRAGMFTGPLVRLQAGASLRSTWVDGQRGVPERYAVEAINVQTWGGEGTTVADNTLSNSAGWTNLQVPGSHEGLPCARTTVTGNLVTAYSSSHFPVGGLGPWTDGLSVGCEDTVVRGNFVVDATDVGIVLFRAHPAVQRSQVTDNHVLSAGNSAYGGIGIDTGRERGVTVDFTGASMSRNHVWTGPGTHFDIGLVVGVRPWFGTRTDPGTGATVNDNTSDGLVVRVGTGIAVSGMLDATVQGNALRFSVLHDRVAPCPHVEIGIDADGFAEGGDIQPGGTPVGFLHPQGGGAGCISTHAP